MRVRHLILAALVVLSAHAASADPVTAPGSTWGDGEGRQFELLWNGSQATFTVENVGASVYTSLDDCCSDVFDRIRQVNPGSSLTFSNLVLNWYAPINTVIEDDLDWNLLKANGFDNLISLTGLVTLNTAPGARRGTPTLAFHLANEEPPVDTDVVRRIPEPGALMLVGSGLLGYAALIRRKMSRSANFRTDPGAR